MAALKAHAGKIGNFVVQVTVLLKHGCTFHKHNVLVALWRQNQAAFFHIQLKGRARLKGKTVGRNMIGRHAYDILESLQPLPHALPRQPPHEVKVDVGAARLARQKGHMQTVLRLVRAAQQAQHAFVHALHANGKPVDAHIQILCRPVAAPQGFRVGLKRHFGLGSQLEILVYALHGQADDARRKQAGRAAAKKYGLHLAAAQFVAPVGQLQKQGVHIVAHNGRGCGIHPAPQRNGMEGTVAATGGAKGNMNVQKHRQSCE